MAHIDKRPNGSYRIKVSCGYSADGKSQKTQSMTWRPPKEGMTEKQLQRALNKAAAEFEQKCAGGQIVNAVKLQSFIESWFEVHEGALKPATLKKYRDLCPRIFSQLGHLRLDKIKTKDLDRFLKWLTNERNAAVLAKCRIDLKQTLKTNGETQKAFSDRAGIDPHVVRSCYHDNAILWDNAVKIAAALDKQPAAVFDKITDGSRLSPKTVHCYHGFLSTIFTYAVKTGEIAVNPCNNCTLPKVPAAEHNILTLEQAKRLLQLLDECAPLKYRCFFYIAIYGGFRRGEILGLRWSDIDFENDLVHINRAAHWDKQRGFYYTDPKTAKSKRTVRLPDRVMFLLKQQHNDQMSAVFNYGDHWNNAENLVFTTDSGSQMSMGTPYSFLKKICEEHELPRISVHSLRHLNATLLINSGANPKTVQALLGHSLASTTMNLYAHEIQSAEAAASAAVAAMLDSQLSAKRSTGAV
ncbi:MAG: site-specific integrase [Ruminococcus sp.]|uniref:tyrosine-type recombinase/integrase n=1 Tax=Ruminococcus sp. TaxID=41978 RepID=UPI0025E6866F|nr:tyrosine-type recombinase/integrase [Ruminococcus sp.]MBR0529382.1 site-specific integrase [Ruminococcus sp.]